MNSREVQFVPFLTADNPTQAIKLRLLLDRAKIPYMVRNEHLQSLFGGGIAGLGYNQVTGPIEFHIPQHLVEEAQETLAEFFEINYEDVPDTCPACGVSIAVPTVDCPSCGLFLG